MLTVTTSLNGPVPSLFCANTLNWYSVPGSSPGTTNQVWAPETGIECQSWGPKSVLFDLDDRYVTDHSRVNLNNDEDGLIWCLVCGWWTSFFNSQKMNFKAPDYFTDMLIIYESAMPLLSSDSFYCSNEQDEKSWWYSFYFLCFEPSEVPRTAGTKPSAVWLFIVFYLFHLIFYSYSCFRCSICLICYSSIFVVHPSVCIHFIFYHFHILFYYLRRRHSTK